MRYFGLVRAVLMYMLLFIFSAAFSLSLFVNEGSFGLNLGVLVIIGTVFYLLCVPLYKARPAFVRMMYLPATLVTIHCTYNLLDLMKRGTPGGLAKDDWSGFVVIPVSFIITVIWGGVFDWKKNRIIKPTIDE